MKIKRFFIAFITLSVITGLSLWLYSTTTDENRNSFVESYSPVIGNISAPVTIVEFFDPACEACASISPDVREILNKNQDKVRLVLRYAPFHGAASKEAISILEAAREQRLFDRVLSALFINQNQWTSHNTSTYNSNTIWQIAISVGLNENRARKYLEENKIERILEQDMKLIDKLKINKTPSFFVNGTMLDKIGPDQLEELVNRKIGNGKF